MYGGELCLLRCLMGNHDEAIETVRRPGFQFRDPDWRKCRYLAPLAHAAKELDDDQAAWLASLPYTTTLPGASAAHASLYQPQAFPFISDAASALPTLELLRERQRQHEPAEHHPLQHPLPTRLVQIDTKHGTLKTWVYNPSNHETRDDGSARSLSGIQWVTPAKR